MGVYRTDYLFLGAKVDLSTLDDDRYDALEHPYAVQPLHLRNTNV